ncbi:MAG TPA: hypothetical protein VHZ25_17550 [Acidobacteriaceae bacterium]|nr:hypothetical protein [Acidobacteriaceae bacterium]
MGHESWHVRMIDEPFTFVSMSLIVIVMIAGATVVATFDRLAGNRGV